jgi:hypothetical protein
MITCYILHYLSVVVSNFEPKFKKKVSPSKQLRIIIKNNKEIKNNNYVLQILYFETTD